MAHNGDAAHYIPAQPVMAAAAADGHFNGNGHFSFTSSSGNGVLISQHVYPRALGAPARQADEYDLLKQIQATHAVDPTKGLQTNYSQLLDTIDIIIRNANSDVQISKISREQMDEEVLLVIERLFCQISYNARFGEDTRKATMFILQLLGNYDWHYKMVLTLAAFVSTYGELWLLVQTYRNNYKLALSTSTLTQSAQPDGPANRFAARFKELIDIIQKMKDVTDHAIKCKDFKGYRNMTEKVEAYSKAVQQAAYWTIMSATVSVTQIFNFATKGDGYIEDRELYEYLQILEILLEELQTRGRDCKDYKEANEAAEEYDELVKYTQQGFSDNLYVLKRLICSEGQELIYSFASKGTVAIGPALEKKNVLLLVSGSEVADSDLSVLGDIYGRTETEREFEVVWVPIVEKWNEDMRENMKNVSWYMVNEPRSMKHVVIEFIKRQWCFTNKTILVALSDRAQMLCLDAFKLIRIWGSKAFPFSKVKLGDLWIKESWGLDLLFPFHGGKRVVGNYEINKKECICWFGGGDDKWVNDFLDLTPKIEEKWGIKIKLVSLGKKTRSTPEVAEVIEKIEGAEHHFVEDFALSFWAKMESIQFSMFQVSSTFIEGSIREEIMKLISYSKHNGWAVLSKGSKLLNILDIATMLSFLKTHNEWEDHDSFTSSFEVNYSKYASSHVTPNVCYKFEFPVAYKMLEVENFKCPECKNPMTEYRTFCCCH